jgi:hypothetical protein
MLYKKLKENYMRNNLFILLILFICSCNSQTENSKTETIFYHYTGMNINSNYKLDTINPKLIPRHHINDSLLATSEFDCKGRLHVIRMYTSDFNAPIDGGQIIYELDNLGSVYSRSTTWHTYYRLRSNNDSINLVIDLALENIILNQNLHCYNCYPPIIIAKEKLSPPDIVKKN